MFPFWNLVIAPLLEAVDAERVVEIGALRGDNTRQLIEAIGPGTELHVIDPSPGFDPSEHEKAFAGQYVFHRALSVDVLGDLPPMDVALIDGDHNWYTVHRELELLADVADSHRRPLPLLILHDVGWPYGRRDLYYDPETIPAEFRQPHRRAGMRPGRSALEEGGGMSAGHWNAEHEGGPRNGVMTALEDFLAERVKKHRQIVLPLYFGLAVVADAARLRKDPRIATVLDRLEKAETKDRLIELGENLRVRSVAHNHTLIGQRDDRLRRVTRRYLDVVISSVLDESRPLSTLDRSALEELDRALADLREAKVDGDVAVIGAGAGGTTILTRAHLDAHDDHRSIWVIDPGGDTASEGRRHLGDALQSFGLDDALVHGIAGPTAEPDAETRLALVLVASDDPDSMRRLGALQHLLVTGGRVVVEHVHGASTQAVDNVRNGLGPHAVSPSQPFGADGLTWARLACDPSLRPSHRSTSTKDPSEAAGSPPTSACSPGSTS